MSLSITSGKQLDSLSQYLGSSMALINIFVKVINLYYYSKPRVIRFLIQLVEILCAIVITIFPVEFRKFKSAEQKITNTIIKWIFNN